MMLQIFKLKNFTKNFDQKFPVWIGKDNNMTVSCELILLRYRDCKIHFSEELAEIKNRKDFLISNFFVTIINSKKSREEKT